MTVQTLSVPLESHSVVEESGIWKWLVWQPRRRRHVAPKEHRKGTFGLALEGFPKETDTELRNERKVYIN